MWLPGEAKGKVCFSKPVSIKLRFKKISVKASAATYCKLEEFSHFHKNSYCKFLLNTHLNTRHGWLGVGNS